MAQAAPIPSHLTDNYASSLPPSGPGSPASRRENPAKAKRKRTLLSLLDALQELSQDAGTEEVGASRPDSYSA